MRLSPSAFRPFSILPSPVSLVPSPFAFGSAPFASRASSLFAFPTLSLSPFALRAGFAVDCLSLSLGGHIALLGLGDAKGVRREEDDDGMAEEEKSLSTKVSYTCPVCLPPPRALFLLLVVLVVVFLSSAEK